MERRWVRIRNYAWNESVGGTGVPPVFPVSKQVSWKIGTITKNQDTSTKQKSNLKHTDKKSKIDHGNYFHRSWEALAR
jgi:hypothetical protein